MRLRVFERWTPANSMLVVCVLLIALIVSLVNAAATRTAGAWVLAGVVAVVFGVAFLWMRSLLRRGRDVNAEAERDVRPERR